jgi:hypothetical protein
VRDHGHLWPAVHDLPGRGHPTGAGHAAVHQHDVRDQLLDQVKGGLAGVGLADHLPAADLLEQRAQDPPDRGMVVDQQDPPGAAGPRDRRLHGLSIGCAGSRMNSQALGFSS